MADTSATPVLSVYTTVNSKVSDLAIQDGQLIFIRDKHKIALDYGGIRTVYDQIEELVTETARTSLLAPVTGRYYYVVDPGVLWTYRDGWVQITTSPSEIAAIQEYAETISKRVTGTIDEDGNYIIMFDENFF